MSTAITDHSASHGFGDHVTPDELRARIEEIRSLNERLDGIELLIGTESNILPDGSPDYADDLLAELDWVIASVHLVRDGPPGDDRPRGGGRRAPVHRRDRAPDRRKIETRAPYEIDMERVIEAAARTGIDDRGQRRAGSARHERDPRPRGGARRRPRAGQLRRALVRNFELRYGIATARRAWLTAGDVANTRSWAEFARCASAPARDAGTPRRSPACARAGSAARATCGRRRRAASRSSIAWTAASWSTTRCPDHRATAATAATWGR